MNKQYAVITADLVNSTRFSSEITNDWLQKLSTLLQTDPSLKWTLAPEIYRGDSFQAVLEQPEMVMRAVIICRAYIKAQGDGAIETDIRIAIGIGSIENITNRPGTSDGQAFRLSGQLADVIKNQNARIGIKLSQASICLDLMMDLLETLIENWTANQSETVFNLMHNKSINQIAEELKISQSAASQRAKSAKWWAIEKLLQDFPEVLKNNLK